MSEQSSYRQILKSSSIIGGSSVLNILIGLGKMKAVALLLGPSGVGLIGLLQSLMGTASTVAGMGFGNVGTRQIAAAAGTNDVGAIAVARRALMGGTAILALLGGLAVFTLRQPLATHVLSDPSKSKEVGWLSLGVVFSVAAASQPALLNGLRRIGDLARLNVLSSLLASALGLTALALWGTGGVLAFIVAAPLASFVAGHWFVARLPRNETPSRSASALLVEGKTLLRLGFAFMASGLAVTVGHLTVRSLIQHDLDLVALGQFQAAWTISATYVGFVLSAMGMDFYPRLTAVISDRAAASRLVNQQTEVALLLAGPVIVTMLGLAPWIIHLLYSAEFAVAADVLRWQVLGDGLKIMSWPLGFVILAAGDGRMYLVTESSAVGLFVFITWIGLRRFGVEATGIAFLGMYVGYLPLVYWLARRRIAFRWERGVVRQFALLVSLAGTTFAIASQAPGLGALASMLFATLLAATALSRLGALTGIGGRVGRLASASRAMLGVLRLKGE